MNEIIAPAVVDEEDGVLVVEKPGLAPWRQTVVNYEWPPNIDQIAAVFPLAREPGILFSYGDRIYNPSGGVVHPALMAHEAVHGDRQLGLLDADAKPFGIEWWWKMYCTATAFRLDEEAKAHIEEYRWWKLNGNRHQRRAMLERIAMRLASPLYGNMITRHQAETILRKGTE